MHVCVSLRKSKISIQRIRTVMATMFRILPEVEHPLIDLSFLIGNDKILVFSGAVVMDSDAQREYQKFVVQELRNQVDSVFPHNQAVSEKIAACA